MIQSKEISIIMQGVANNDTDKVLLNLRSFFPDAEIIFSTWKGNTYHNDKINTIVESEDPGAYPLLDNPLILNSQNREIVGIYNGLLKAKRKYSLKVKTDMYFENINFLSYMHKFPKRCSQYKFLKERILCSTSFTINPHRDPKPFHLSDWFYFGLTEDLLKVFSSPLAPEPETSRYFETHFRPKDKYDAWFPVYTRYPAEQYIWLAFVKRFSDIHCKDCFDISNNNIEKCEIIFANNTVLLDAANIRYSSYKYKKMHKHNDLSRMYSHREWLKLYKKYCDSSVHIPLVDMEKIRRCFWAILKNKKYRLQNNLKYNFMSLLGISFSDPFNQKEKNKIRPFIKERIMLKYIKYKILYIFSHSEKDKWKYKEAKTWLKTQKNLKKCISPETFFVIGDSHTDVFNQNMLYKKIRLAEWKLKSNFPLISVLIQDNISLPFGITRLASTKRKTSFR